MSVVGLIFEFSCYFPFERLQSPYCEPAVHLFGLTAELLKRDLEGRPCSSDRFFGGGSDVVGDLVKIFLTLKPDLMFSLVMRKKMPRW